MGWDGINLLGLYKKSWDCEIIDLTGIRVDKERVSTWVFEIGRAHV